MINFFKFKLCLLLVLVLSASNLLAQAKNTKSKIYLLTSINSPNALLRTKDFIEKDTEKVFKNAFKNSSYEYIVLHKVGQVQLQKIITSEDTLGVFWVSHANEQESASSLGVIKASNNITDVNGLNAKHIFQKIHPNVKFLGVIGCRANDIFKDFDYTYNKSLKIFSFSEKITAKDGLLKAINASIDVLGDDSPTQKDRLFPTVYANPKNLKVDPLVCHYKQGIHVKVKRLIPRNETKNAVKILLNKSTLLGQFPRAQASDHSDLEQVIDIYLPDVEYQNKDELLLSVETMEAVEKGHQNYGEITFGEDNNWKLFTNKNGQAVGGRDHIYFFVGNIALINFQERSWYTPFKCVPAY